MEKVLFVGNGINLGITGISWGELVNRLVNTYTNNEIGYDPNKPFPILFETIVNKAKELQLGDEKRILTAVCFYCREIEGNSIHKIILDKYNSIITTNYDYNIEKTVNEKWTRNEYRETKYSLYRFRKNKDKTIWHIHGEDFTPSSICLGYDHYSGFLQYIREYVVGQKEGYESIIHRILAHDTKINSWIDHFFFSDIDIIGSKLEFVEIELWWLIIYRFRIKVQNDIKIKNKIRYFINENCSQNDPKVSLLKDNGIEICVIKTKTYDEEFYLSYFRDFA